MQTADMRNGDDLALFRRLSDAKMGSVLLKRSMRSQRMVIGEIVPEQFHEMLLVQNDHMVEQLSPQSANQPFAIGILPGGAQAQ